LTLIIILALLPLLGTTLGAGTVFFLPGCMPHRLHRGLLGFAGGVMLAASVWSLLLPAISLSESMGLPAWLPPAAGFLLGILFLLGLDRCLVRLSLPLAGEKHHNTMLALAVTLHNLPEGMAVGVVLAELLSGSNLTTPAAAAALSIGIAIQNFPEGAIISLPLYSGGARRKKAFAWGFLSGVVEPLGAGLTLLLTRLLTPVLPFILSFAAGAMVYAVVEDLLPEARSENTDTIVPLMLGLGFCLMMGLDVALG